MAKSRVPVVVRVLKPVDERLSRIEDLLLEMRHEQDVQLKHLTKVQRQLDALTERVAADKRRRTAKPRTSRR